MKMRRVLFVAETAKGGAAFSLYHLVKELARGSEEPIVLFYAKHPYIIDKLVESGIKTLVLHNRPQAENSAPTSEELTSRDVAGWLAARVSKSAGRTYTFLKACYLFLRKDIPRILPIVQTIRLHKIELVHVNTGLRHGKAGVLAAWLAKRPCVCHVRMFHELNDFDKLFGRFVNKFIYISGAIGADCAAQGIPQDQGVIIHNAVDLGEFALASDPAAVRREFNWTDNERLVGVIGRLDWWKGHDYFLRALAQVKERLPDVRGLIVGAPETSARNRAYFQELRELARSLGLEESVVFTGFRSDVPRLMAALEIVVLSSSAPEPFGRVVIEGMAAGKPVIATAAGGVLDIIEDGVNGLLIPGQDATAMAQAMLRLLLNPELARQIASAARERVGDKFTVQHQAAAVRRVYDSLTNTRSNHLVSIEVKGA